MSRLEARPHVAVVGGGLAGISAAIALCEMGWSVTLLEARPRLGGATCSFRRGDLTIDNGQHVFLRCCTAYRGLLARLGMSGAVSMQDRFDVTVLSPSGAARLRRSALPRPLHLAAALAGYRFLSPAERLRAVTAALAMARLDPAQPELDGVRLGDWMAAHRQDQRTRRALWDLFTVSTLNVAGDDANLALAATVVKTALLSASDAADIGIPAVPLGELHGRAAASLLSREGASVLVNAKVVRVELAAGGFRIRLAGPGRAADARGLVAGPGAQAAGERAVDADAVVLAVPPAAAAALAPPAAHGQQDGKEPVPGPPQWRQLGTSPIVNVHVIYDRRVTRLPFAATVDSPVQWAFDRTGPSGLQAGQYLALSLSAANRYVDVPAARLGEQFLPELARLFPAARKAGVADFFVTRERRATLSQVPGCQSMRPSAATALPGLVLAGAWTATGWPDTMEGAVRSGLNAARALRACAAVPVAARRQSCQFHA